MKGEFMLPNKRVKNIMTSLKFKYLWPIERAIRHAKLQVLIMEARRLNVFLAYTKDLQGSGFYVLTPTNPLFEENEAIAIHLNPGAGMDVYFPAPLKPCLMHIYPFTEKNQFYGSIKKGLKHLRAAHRRLITWMEFQEDEDKFQEALEEMAKKAGFKSHSEYEAYFQREEENKVH